MREKRHRRGGRAFLWLKILLCLVLAGALLWSAALGLVLVGDHDEVEGDPKIMIILGCQVMSHGPSVLLQDRLDRALTYLEDHPDMTVVVSGGQGPDEPTTEAAAMRDYLVDRGANSDRILLEEDSHNTVQNLNFTMELLAAEGYDVTDEMLVVSNGFHLARTRMLWDRVTGSTENLSTLSAPATHKPSRLKMYIREPMALVKSFLFDR